MHTHFNTTCHHCAEKDRQIARLSWNEGLGMLNQAGLWSAINTLPDGAYIIVFADIDRLKALNSATGSHMQSNRYLKEGLRVRDGELAGQLLGDEIVFILPMEADAPAFIRRIRRQLAGTPLTTKEREALIKAGGDGRLSATFASEVAEKSAIPLAIESCSRSVLSQKAVRDARSAHVN